MMRVRLREGSLACTPAWSWVIVGGAVCEAVARAEVWRERRDWIAGE
jgi:hypothetical protein